MKRTTIIETITVLFIILFHYTSISKVLKYNVFREQVAASPVLSPMASLVAHWLPIAEILLIVLLVVPRKRLKEFYVATALMIVFTIYIIAIMIFNDQLRCSCKAYSQNSPGANTFHSIVPLLCWDLSA